MLLTNQHLSDTQLNYFIKKKRLENCMKFSSIIHCVLFCGKQNLALRGHRDDAKYLRIGGNNELSGTFEFDGTIW